jgi:NADPH2:quinone reductase
MRAWVLRAYGEPEDVLALEDVAVPSPAPHQVLVEVEAVGIAFPDLLRVRGKYQVTQPLGSTPGAELVGHVCGRGSDGGPPDGTRVIGISEIGDGALAEYALMTTTKACQVPEGLARATAATLPANYVTAHLALHTRARVQPGEVVVVTGGAGGVGSAAIQLAVCAGARVLAVDLGADRAARCVQYGAHAGVDSSAGDLVDKVMAFSDGHGGDVVIDTVGGDVFDACRRCIASQGRIVVVGFTGGRIPELRLNQLILRNFTVMGVNGFFHGDEWADLTRLVVELALQNRIAPPVEAEYSFDEVPAVFTRLAEGKVEGRAVIRMR